MELSRLEYCMLKILKKNNCKSFFESMTLQEIIEVTHTSRPTTYRKMMKLKDLGYVEKGCKSTQADTFYLLKKGVDLIEKKGE